MSQTVTPIVPHGRNNTSPAPGPEVKITGDVGPVKEITTFNIRNGNVNAARSLLVRPTVSQCYHWCPIAGLPHDRAMENMAAYIKVAYVQLQGGLTKEKALLKKIAICIGVARAVVTQLYAITDSDLIAGERAAPLLVATQGEGTSTTLKFSAVADVKPNVLALLNEELSFDEAEQAAIAALHMSAIGLPAVQGYSLVMCQHHYLSDPKSQSRKAYDVIERAFWRDDVVRPWFEADTADIQDALWHKACHPIIMNIKIKFSQSDSVVSMIKIAGAGPAASRLPALESELRSANSFKTLMMTVRTMYAVMASEVDMIPLQEAIFSVEHYPLDAVDVAPHTYATVPSNVIDRKTALRHLGRVCEANKDVFAHAYGFYKAMMERTELVAGTGSTDTLISSYSLSKLPQESPAAYIHGRTLHEDYVAKKKYHRGRGEYMAFHLFVKAVTSEGNVLPPEPAGMAEGETGPV